MAVQCKQCGQPVPEGTTCPRCGGAGGATESDAMRGGLAGGLKGLFLGILPMIVLLMEYSTEHGAKVLALALPLVTAATGFLIGFLRARRKR